MKRYPSAEGFSGGVHEKGELVTGHVLSTQVPKGLPFLCGVGKTKASVALVAGGSFFTGPNTQPTAIHSF